MIITRPVLGGRGRLSVDSSGGRVNSLVDFVDENFTSFGVTTTLMELGGAADCWLWLRISIWSSNILKGEGADSNSLILTVTSPSLISGPFSAVEAGCDRPSCTPIKKKRMRKGKKRKDF